MSCKRTWFVLLLPKTDIPVSCSGIPIMCKFCYTKSLDISTIWNRIHMFWIGIFCDKAKIIQWHCYEPCSQACLVIIGWLYSASSAQHLSNSSSSIVGEFIIFILSIFFSQTGDACYLDIGDNNEIREHSSIHRSSKSSDRTVGP